MTQAETEILQTLLGYRYGASQAAPRPVYVAIGKRAHDAAATLAGIGVVVTEPGPQPAVTHVRLAIPRRPEA